MTQGLPTDPAMRRLLRRLATRGAWLCATGFSNEAVPNYRLMSGLGPAQPPSGGISPALVSDARARGWIAIATQGTAGQGGSGEGRLTLTAAGAENLRRVLSGRLRRQKSRGAPSGCHA